jgi:hypothetical protein
VPVDGHWTPVDDHWTPVDDSVRRQDELLHIDQIEFRWCAQGVKLVSSNRPYFVKKKGANCPFELL